MVSTRRRRRQSRGLLSQLIKFADNFMITQDNHKTQTESIKSTVGKNVASGGKNQLILDDVSQVDVQRIQRSITDRVRCEVGNVAATAENWLLDARFFAMSSLLTFGVERAKCSVIVSCGWDPSSVVLHPDKRILKERKKPSNRFHCPELGEGFE